MHEQNRPQSDEPLTREDVVERLTRVSPSTWTPQAQRNKGARRLDPSGTEHDRELAEDAVRKMERLGVLANIEGRRSQ